MKIVIPEWLEKSDEKLTDFCECINQLLEACPDMTLAEFARDLDFGIKQQTLKRVRLAEGKQFGGNANENQ